MRRSEKIFLLIIFLYLALAMIAYRFAPDQMAVRWGLGGEAEYYISRFWGVFAFPLISVFLFISFLIFPKIDPLRKNIEKFQKYFDLMIISVLLFLLYLYALVLIWNFGYYFNMIQALAPGFSALWFCVGVLLSKTERNWVIGIRTPWTLTSDQVWRETHIFAGNLIKLSALITLLGLIAPRFALLLIIGPIMIVIIAAMAGSYFIYRRINQKHKP